MAVREPLANENTMNDTQKYLLFPLLTLLLLASCTRSDFQVTEDPSNSTFGFTLTLPDPVVVQTKSEEDQTINNLYVVVFDGNTPTSLLIDSGEAFSMGNTYYVQLKPTTTAGFVYILANVAQEMLSTGDATGARTLEQVQKALLVKLQQQDGHVISDPTIAPMSSELLDYAAGFSTSDNVLRNILLKRATAKVTIVDKSEQAQSFNLLGANLGNAPTLGYVLEGVGVVSSPNLAHYAGRVFGNTYSIDAMMRSASLNTGTNHTTTDPLYLFESKKENQTFVIIKSNFNGADGYHRLNLWDRDTKEFYGIKRNYHYIISINKIGTAGYRTAQEAIEAQPSNKDIDYEIEITDPYSHDIVTNGEQYLTVSNSELRIYQSGEINDLVATTFSYTVPTPAQNTWTTGSITAKGTGLSIVGATGNVLSLPVQEVQSRELKVNLAQNFTSGTLELRMGNLAKIIKITKSPNLGAVSNEMQFDNCAVGDRTSSGDMKSEIRFAGVQGMYPQKDEYDNIYASATSSIYALVDANIGYRDNVSVRSGEFYVASLNHTGRIKVMFRQEKLDVYTQLSQIKPYTYVGTFHRANETAERIIRIKSIKKNPKDTWTAIVVAGNDFIELDTHDSPDPGINKYNPYGYDELAPDDQSRWDNPQYTTAAEIEANCQFTPDQKGKSVVSGTGDLIYFRVGMKSTLGATDRPRYGLIALLHSGGTHMIYVRQGEEADYLMRGQDLINQSGVSLAARPDAVKVAPFNLTVPAGMRGNKYHDLPTQGGAFTDYPSKGGYFFQGNSNRAFFPVGTSAEVNWSNGSGAAAGNSEVCPADFRRPNDGPVVNNGFVVGSEIRQSFWLNPQNGTAQSNFGNMLRGYIADGYYDRRVMRVPNSQGRSNEGVRDIYNQETVMVDNVPTRFTIPTMVGDGAEIGYAGMLLFNPNNFASIFMPANGSRNGQINRGDLIGTGGQFNIWSSSFNNSGQTQLWYLATGYYNSQFVFDNYYSIASMEGFSIRCVRK